MARSPKSAEKTQKKAPQSSAQSSMQRGSTQSNSAKKNEEKIPTISALEEDILTALLSQRLYGLQICDAISDSSGGRQTLKVGSLYPCLHRMEKKGLVHSEMDATGVESRGGNRRKYYRITGEGAEALSIRQRTRKNLMIWKPAIA